MPPNLPPAWSVVRTISAAERLGYWGCGPDRDAPAVVAHPAAAVGQQGDVDPGAVAGHGLVDGVVDDLPHQVVQAGRPGRPDVHPGALPDRLQALEDGDVTRAVGVRRRYLVHLQRHRRALSKQQSSGSASNARTTGCPGMSIRRSQSTRTVRLSGRSRGRRDAASGRPLHRHVDPLDRGVPQLPQPGPECRRDSMRPLGGPGRVVDATTRSTDVLQANRVHDARPAPPPPSPPSG